MNFDDEPGTGHKREESSGEENRGGQAGAGKNKARESQAGESQGDKKPKEGKDHTKRAVKKPEQGNP